MDKKCELCGKKKQIEELGIVTCKECEDNYESKISEWYILAIGISFIILLNIYEVSTISFIAGLAFGVMIGLLLNKGDEK